MNVLRARRPTAVGVTGHGVASRSAGDREGPLGPLARHRGVEPGPGDGVGAALPAEHEHVRLGRRARTLGVGPARQREVGRQRQFAGDVRGHRVPSLRSRASR